MSSRHLLLESCEERILCDAVPQVSVTTPPTSNIGEEVQVTATFDNTSPTDTGFGPYLDVYLDSTGVDGAGTEVDDGVTFVGASYQGTALNSTVLTFDAAGQAIHPYAKDANGAPLVISAAAAGYQPGDSLVVIQLPFGSFAPGQPPAQIDITLKVSELADINDPLGITVQGGFQYGNDALDNPTSDPTIVGPAASSTITPSLYTLKKVYLGPEDETVTGPNYTRQYRIELDVATGQTLTNVQLEDILSNSLQFVSVASVTGGTVIDSLDPSTTTPGGTLSRTLDSVTGAAGVDATLTFNFYVPRIDTAPSEIINPSTGDDVTITNDATATAHWDPLDERDDEMDITVTDPVPDHILTVKSIATQKSVALVNDTGSAGPTPGDTLEYTIDVQISDYFAFNNLTLTDLISDGQVLDSSFTPIISWTEHNNSFGPQAFLAGNYTVTSNFSGGSDRILFNISGEIARPLLQDGLLLGGAIPSGGTGGPPPANQPPLPYGPTTLRITFRTTIQDAFEVDFPSGNPSLEPGDTVGNNITVSGDVLDRTNLTPTGNSESDTSNTTVTIQGTSLQKTVYAINGSTTLPTTPSGQVLIRPGDTVTYRITYVVPSGDVQDLRITDYLPLPIFNVAELVSFSTAPPSATPPPAGTGSWGPTETFRDVAGNPTPTPSVDFGNNSVTFNYGTVDDLTNTSRTIDILFTVTVSNIPFADGLLLTNLVQATQNNTQEETSTSDATTQVVIQEPAVLASGKGVVGYNDTGLTLGGITFTAPGTTSNFSGGPISDATQSAAIRDSDLLGGLVDTGDIVRFGLVLLNSGQTDAFDVIFKDQVINPGYNLPTGATDADRLASINFTLRRGDGTLLVNGVDYNATLTAGGLLTVEMIDNYNAGPGDVGTGGVNRGFDAQAGTAIINGSNVIIATYDLVLTPGVANAGATLVNTATLINYSNTEGGPDFTPVDPSDTALVEVARPELAKTLVGTSVTTGNNTNTQAVIGELVTYSLVLTVPEGSMPLSQIIDNLDPGLAFVDIVSVTLSAGVSTSNSIGTGVNPTNVPVATGGGQLTFNFGTITNTNTDNTVTETITILYRAVVLNQNTTPNIQAGTTLNNQASFSAQYTDLPTGSPQSYTEAQAEPTENVTVIEPRLDVAKGVGSAAGGPFTDLLSGVDAGDTVFYQIQITNAAGRPTAFDIFLNDTLSTLLTGLSVASVTTSGFSGTAPVAGDFIISGGVLMINPAGPLAGNIDMVGGSTLTITVQGTLVSTVQPNQSISNDATIRWTSIDGTPGTISTYNTSSTERTGGNLTPASGVNASDNDSILNNYAATDGAVIRIANPTPTKVIDATSEVSTTIVGGVERVTIGEIVRYRIVWQIPEGVSNNLVITDLLPTGMQFLNDGTATLAFVSSGGNISSSIGSIGLLASVAGDQSTLGTINPQFVIPAAQISGGAFGNGTDPVFSLGNVTNPDNDTNQEFVVIEFNASVLNIASNQAFNNVSGAGPTAVNLNNSVRVQTSTSDVTSTPVQVRITEPAITNVLKVASPGPYDAGDVVTYTVTFSNVNSTSASTAFDVVMTDLLSPFFTNVTFISAVAGSTGTVTGLSGSNAGNTILVVADSMAPGATITVTYSATLINVINTGEVVTNTARVTYSSLPGSGNALDDGVPSTTNSTPGTPGGFNGERDGSNGEGPDDPTLNNYADSSTAAVTIGSPHLDKSFKDGTLTEDDTNVTSSTGATVVIGEKVYYDILVTLPEGLTSSLVIQDIVPAGLRIDSMQILVLPTQTPLLTGVFSGGFQFIPVLGARFSGPGTLDLNFGDVLVPDDNIDTNDSFVIRLEATVLNVVGNQTGTALTNTATLTFGATSPTTITDSNTANDPTVMVDEPLLTVTKVADNLTPDAGDPVQFTVTIANSVGSTQTAYDLVLEDVLPPGYLNPSLVSVTSTGPVYRNGVLATLGTSDLILDNGVLRFNPASNIDMGPGATITIVGTGVVTGNASPNAQAINTAVVDWTSTDGGNPDERTGVEGEGGALNNYETSDTVIFTVPAAEFGKVLATTSAPSTTGSNVTIGETVTYALVVNLGEVTVNDLIIQDHLPPGMQFVSYQLVTLAADSFGQMAADFNGTIPIPTVTGGTTNGEDVTFTFGQIVVTDDNITNNDRFVILVTARVLDVATNVGLPPGQTVLPNTATFDITGDGELPFTTSPVSVVVVEPQMVIVKGITPGVGDAGDPVTISLTVQNTGTSTAFDVVVEDPLIAAKFAGISEGITPTGFTFAVVGSTVRFTGGSIAAGASVTFTFNAVLTQSVVQGELIFNEATVSNATTLPGVVTGERTEPPASDQDFIAIATGNYTKTLFATSDANTPGDQVGIGETVTYALKVTLPEGTTNTLSVTDLIPDGLRYLSFTLVTTTAGSGGLLTGNFNGIIPNPAVSGGVGNGADVTFTFGTITSTGDNVTTNNSFLILLTAQVLDVGTNVGTDESQTVLDNNAAFNYGTGIAVTPVVPVTVVEPRLQITKAASDNTPDPGDVLTYALVIEHTGSSTSIAYDVILRDVIPAGLTMDTASIMVNGVAVALSTLVDSNTSTSNLLALKFTELALGDTITITYEAQVSPAAGTGGSIYENTAKIYWDTQAAEDPNIVFEGGTPGSDGSEDRDYGAGPGNEIFDQDTDPAQDTERVVVNSNSISGVVYLDADVSGDFTAGDTGIVGVTLTLTGTDLNGSAISLQTVTGINGSYTFTGLSAGTYSITETQPILYVDALETAGTPFGGTVSGALNSNDITNIVIPEQLSQSGIDYNFGEIDAATISGRVYIDQNASQTYDSGEAGIQGVVVTLTGTDAAGEAVSLTTVTTIGGLYAFVGLRPGTYTITESQPAGYLDGADSLGTPFPGTVGNDVISDILITTGQNGTEYNFGELRPSSLSGFVYYDKDNNGIFAAGETPIAGAQITLSGTDYLGNAVNQVVTTNSLGYYEFTNLLPGTYVISEAQPAGFLDGKDTIGTPGGATGNDVFTNILLGENVSGANNNFGELAPSTVQGSVYVDADNDGIFDAGEQPLENVSMRLTGTDDLGNAVDITVVTNASGAFSFTNLRPGTYTLTETQPNIAGGFAIDYLDGRESAGTTGGAVNNAVDSQTISNFILPSGTNSIRNNFGELIASSLAGTVYEDLDNDGVIDSGENGIPNVVVRLTGTDDRGNAIDTTITVTTDANGNYIFEGLRPGVYTIRETQPVNPPQPFDYLDGKDTIGTPGGTAGNDVFSNITVVSGTTGVGNNFGELPPASISGNVYIDSDNDGVFDGTESPIDGVTVTLTGTDDLGNPISLTTTTDSNGLYFFTNLRPGTYTIAESQPTGYLDGKDTPGTNGASLGLLNDRIVVNIVADTDSADNNFGELRPSSISGHVYIDADNDGVRDLLELPVQDVEVRLTGIDDLGNVVNLVATTNFLGHYEFINLRPGAYVLTEVQPEQLLDGKDSLGTQGGLPFNDRFTFTLTENVNGTDNDFGELRPASISGYVYEDRNSSGTLDPGEPGIPGATVLLTGIDDLGNAVSRTTITDAAGRFVFDRLRPGTYNLFEVQPAGYSDGIDTAGTNGGTVGNDFIGTIVLEQGDNAELYLFGEHRIPKPPTPKPPKPSPDDGGGSEPIPFAFDAFNNFSIRPDSFRLPVSAWQFPALPLAPIYSGSANPGATLVVELYSADGTRVGHTTVLADAGGNWIANFPSAPLLDTPTSVRVTQTNVPFAFGSGLGKNLRAYYAPVGLNPGQFVSLSSEMGPTFGDGAPLLGGLDLSNPLQLGAAKYGSEMLPAGGVASGY